MTRKIWLFGNITCHGFKDAIRTKIDAGEHFVRTSHKVMVLPAESFEPIENTVYSLKRGKRTYYTPAMLLTQEQIDAAR